MPDFYDRFFSDRVALASRVTAIVHEPCTKKFRAARNARIARERRLSNQHGPQCRRFGQRVAWAEVRVRALGPGFDVACLDAAREATPDATFEEWTEFVEDMLEKPADAEAAKLLADMDERRRVLGVNRRVRLLGADDRRRRKRNDSDTDDAQLAILRSSVKSLQQLALAQAELTDEQRKRAEALFETMGDELGL